MWNELSQKMRDKDTEQLSARRESEETKLDAFERSTFTESGLHEQFDKRQRR